MRVQSGFTLIELVVSIAILAVLSLYTAKSIQQAVRTKVKIEKEIERTSVVREALRVMERDINLAFNYRDINVELYNQAGLERQKQAQTSPSPSPAFAGGPPVAPPTVPGQQLPPFKPKQQVILTQFLGTDKDLSFTTISNVKTQADQQISDQAVIGYSLKDCTNWVNRSWHSKCLLRRVNPIISDDITKGGDETVLLENVTRFELRYLGPGRETEWLKEWYSDGHGGSDSNKNKFPYAVEITIEAQNKNIAGDKPVQMTWVAALRFPNNPEPSSSPGVNNGEQQIPPPISPTH